MKLIEKQEILKTGDFNKLSEQQAKEWLEDLKQSKHDCRNIGCFKMCCDYCKIDGEYKSIEKDCADYFITKLNEVLEHNYSVCFGSKASSFTKGENVFYGGIPLNKLLTKIKIK